MERSAALTENPASHPHLPPESSEATAIILRELEKILESPPFRGSSRRKEFLSYVVRHSLEGHHDLLKERTIGTEVFHRDADYATGDDPVVRVQAGEVRRRLEQYYYTAPDVPVRIEIPIGSYHPEFHWNTHALPKESHAEQAIETNSHAVAQDSAGRRRWFWLLIAAVCLVGIVLGIAVFSPGLRHHKPPQSLLELFWAPVFKTSQPVIICLAKPVVYRPSVEIYERYARSHPGTFESESERDNEVLPLNPNAKLTWGDMMVYPGYGVASGDAYAAVQISNLLVRMGKPSQVRIGKSYSFEDLIKAPAVVLGAFNNKWTMQMTSNLHFALQFDAGIREQIPSGRVWTSQFNSRGEYTADYGVVSRLLDSKTGQFLVSAGGIGSPGTQAAGEVVSNPQYLEEALRTAPADWDKKDFQLVVQTNVIDSIPGPPHVVAAYFW
ncbi:hypothetical protein H7849_24390 [Alloacidobacterium dinghuense]|uniref:Adenylate cyclase n=1 Tax=Alloacidobacterium dinghuense TaxID=2763107 RepID=A0A7G8BHS8_9BACT|nr:hypothetical protein [Alloacidobacterium dinghuense]QNI32098.1 hypothetical protein H7849_24390 [Alloacidobacterium dinghuense]